MRWDGLVAEVQNWAAGLEEVHARIAGRFARAEPRARALAYLRGLLGQSERKNGRTLAEAAGEVSPDGMQRLLRTADWDVDAVRDELRGYVVERLGPDGVLIVDETGFIKKGSRSAGWPGSTPAPPARSTTVRSGCFWPTPRRRVGRGSPGSSTCPRPGSGIGPGPGPPASAVTSASPPSRSWPAACSAAPW